MSWSSSVAAPARTWSGSAAGSRGCAGSLSSISARRFSSRHGRAPARLSNVEVVEADITRYQPPQPGGLRVSLVRAHHGGGLAGHHRQRRGNDPAGRDIGRGGLLCLLRATGRRSVVRHPAWERWLWRRWFAHDGVRLDPGHMAQLATAMPDCQILEGRGRVPYLPGLGRALLPLHRSQALAGKPRSPRLGRRRGFESLEPRALDPADFHGCVIQHDTECDQGDQKR